MTDFQVERNSFRAVQIDLRHAEISFLWKGTDGRPLENFEAVRREIRQAGKRLVFAANAGIFEPGFTPTGLWVEHGEQRVPLNRGSGNGNFYLKPNGVFCVGRGRAWIVETEQYSPEGVQWATQSGPLLLSGGKINSILAERSPNRQIRSGVGIAEPQRVVFILSQVPVTFHELAQAFVERGCNDALYLDGTISQFYWEGTVTGGSGGGFAGMIAVGK